MDVQRYNFLLESQKNAIFVSKILSCLRHYSYESDQSTQKDNQ